MQGRRDLARLYALIFFEAPIYLMSRLPKRFFGNLQPQRLVTFQEGCVRVFLQGLMQLDFLFARHGWFATTTMHLRGQGFQLASLADKLSNHLAMDRKTTPNLSKASFARIRAGHDAFTQVLRKWFPPNPSLDQMPYLHNSPEGIKVSGPNTRVTKQQGTDDEIQHKSTTILEIHSVFRDRCFLGHGMGFCEGSVWRVAGWDSELHATQISGRSGNSAYSGSGAQQRRDV